MQAAYDTKLGLLDLKFRQMEDELSRLRDAAILKELREQQQSEQEAVDSDGGALPLYKKARRRRVVGDNPAAVVDRRQLATDAPDLTDRSGVAIRTNDSYVSFGFDADASIVRMGYAQLGVFADTVTMNGHLCIGSNDACLSVSDGALMFNSEAISGNSSGGYVRS